MDMFRVTAVVYISVSFSVLFAGSVVMDDDIWISGKAVSMLGKVPFVTPSFPKKRNTVPVTTQ